MIALVVAMACHRQPVEGEPCSPYRPSPPGPSRCEALGEPCSGCGSYANRESGCGGTVQGTGEDAWCEMHQPLADWCATQLPCWLGPGCPDFHEFLFVSGWLEVLPAVGESYDWSWSSAEYAHYATTSRCGLADGSGFENFNWPTDQITGIDREAYFDTETGRLLGVREFGEPMCCGDATVEERLWGTKVTGCAWSDYEYASFWEDCAESNSQR